MTYLFTSGDKRCRQRLWCAWAGGRPARHRARAGTLPAWERGQRALEGEQVPHDAAGHVGCWYHQRGVVTSGRDTGAISLEAVHHTATCMYLTTYAIVE